MKPDEYDIKEFTAANNGRKFWLYSFTVYAAFEVLYTTVTYIITYSKCKACVLSFPFYSWELLANLLLSAFLWYSLNHFYRQSLWKIIAINIFIFLVYYFSWIGMLYAVLNSNLDWLLGTKLRYRPFESVVYGSWFDIGKYVLKLSAFYVLKFYFEYRKAAQQRIQLAVINKDMQLNLLKQQLSPHFYFNTLNNLYGLSRSNSPRLSGALSQLSGIMQYVIVDCNQSKVLLKQEINFLQSYIELEKLRYEKDTVIEMKVIGQVSTQTILPLLLIQFVENAFKHGMKEKSDRSWMRVNIHVEGNELIFNVTNSYYDVVPSQGIGINSVKHILNLQYEGRHEIQMLHEKNNFSVILKLNLL
jgi:two-component system LytT family sensor kinase